MLRTDVRCFARECRISVVSRLAAEYNKSLDFKQRKFSARYARRIVKLDLDGGLATLGSFKSSVPMSCLCLP